VSALDVALADLKSDEAFEAGSAADIECITALAQAILQAGWRRVKAGT
jgi:hypothetical protein